MVVLTRKMRLCYKFNTTKWIWKVVMPLIEYGCYDCKKISESLIRDRYNIPESARCEHCKGENTVRLISRVNYKMQKKAKYDDEFLGKAMPAMMKKKETAEYFAEGPGGSDESKMFEMGEQIGERIDRMIESSFPKK